MLLLLLILSACGPIRIAHDHSGEVVHTIQIDPRGLDEYFDLICDLDPVCALEQKSFFLNFMKAYQ